MVILEITIRTREELEELEVEEINKTKELILNLYWLLYLCENKPNY